VIIHVIVDLERLRGARQKEAQDDQCAAARVRHLAKRVAQACGKARLSALR